MKRIFIAVKVEAGVNLLNMISSIKSGLENEKVSWINPDNIHITLAFLGDTKEKQTKSAGAVLKEKCEGSGSFELILKGSGVFKSLNDPRIFWTGIEPSEKMIQLCQLIKTGLTESGFIIDNRPFKPHLTLGRIKHIGDTDILKRVLESYKDTEIQKVPVNEVILYESVLLPTGALYKPIVKISL